MSDLVDDARRGDRDLALWPTGVAALLLDLLDDVHALNNFAEHDVFSIKPRSYDPAEDDDINIGSSYGKKPARREGESTPLSRTKHAR